MPSTILGISAYYHDSAAALLVDGEIFAAAHEERFTRIKHDFSFPAHAATYVINEAGIDPKDIEAVAFYDKPYLKFERLLETYHELAPTGWMSFVHAIPVWIKEKLFMRSMINKELASIGMNKPRLLFPEHHVSHAASAFYPSPFEEAAILTVDGVGEWATSTIGHGKGNEIELLRQLNFPHSLGLLYSAFTYYCGFKVNSGEYKLMGLAPYGNPTSERTLRWKQAIYDELIDVRDDGSLLLNMDYFAFATGLSMCVNKKWEELFGIPARPFESPISDEYMDLSQAIQQVTEEIVFRMADTAHHLTGSDSLCMAGGVALNCVANGKLLKRGPFKNLWIQPAAGDAGGSVGAALASWHIWKNEARTVQPGDSMRGAYLGPQYADVDIIRTARRYNAPFTRYDDFGALCDEVSKRLDAGEAVGWFQGRMEYGPRALGNRSILGDPRKPDMQKKLNLKIKYREGFRPFAPAVLEEVMGEFFDLDCPSPYMLLVAPVVESRRNPLPDDEQNQDLMQRLYHTRSDVPAITHVDYSARIQTVSDSTNPRFAQLLRSFKALTQYGILVNTSFNVRGEPIVCTPQDAYRCFMRTEMDTLVLGNFVFTKSEQPEFPEKDDWQSEFTLD